MPNKPDQLPHEDEPYEDRRAATQRALNQAQWHAPGQITAAQGNYARKAFEREIEALKSQAKGCRNDALNKAAFSLAQLVAAGALEAYEVRHALHDACRVNGHLGDDGEHMVSGTIESGFENGLKHPRDLSTVTGSRMVLTEDEPRTITSLTIPDIESGFWTKRESLQTVYLGALARMCSPWAVLAYCVARALTLVRPSAVLPPLIGGHGGSLNWFAAIAAVSGGGKGSAASVARELVNELVMTRNLGSGEGLIDAYVKPANKETGEPRGLHEAIMFMADEIDTMAALGMRNGATLSGILRSAFTAETIGFSYRTASSEHLKSHTYRLTLVANVQPAKAGALMDDQYGGTLQRFMWFPGTDARVDAVTPVMPGPLLLPSYSCWQYPRELQIPYIAKHLIKQERAKSMQGSQDHLDGHALFIREKFAYGLTVLDGRDEMTEEDWRLAGVASRVSDHTREWVSNQLHQSADEMATEKGRLHGILAAASDEERTRATNRRINDIAKLILKKIKSSADGMTKGELNHAVTSRDRVYLQAALDVLSRNDLIRQTDDGKRAQRWMCS